ncbi:MAG: hypothetical protein C4331_08830 [Meiothermus sp.]
MVLLLGCSFLGSGFCSSFLGCGLLRGGLGGFRGCLRSGLGSSLCSGGFLSSRLGGGGFFSRGLRSGCLFGSRLSSSLLGRSLFGSGLSSGLLGRFCGFTHGFWHPHLLMR